VIEPTKNEKAKDFETKLKELERFIPKGQLDKALEAADYILEKGGEPKAAIVESVKKNNVTFLGEMHTVDTSNPHRELIAETMKDLPKGSRLAIEVPDVLKPVFDKFNKSKPGSEFEIPDKLQAEFGKQALQFLHRLKESSPELIEMWKAARDNGIKITPIDNSSSFMSPNDPRRNTSNARRDSEMKQKLLAMVKENPASHIVAELGNLHAGRAPEGKSPHRSVAALLSSDSDFKNLGGKIETFYAQISEGPGKNAALWPASFAIDKPLAVKTKADGKANTVGDMPMYPSARLNGIFNYHLRDFDNVILYPPPQKK
jgi:hypothetical protein